MSGTSVWPSTPRLASARRLTEGRSSCPARRGPRSGHWHRPASASAVSADIACPAFRMSRRSSRSRRRDCSPASPGRGPGAARPRAARPDPLHAGGSETSAPPTTGAWLPPLVDVILATINALGVKGGVGSCTRLLRRDLLRQRRDARHPLRGGEPGSPKALLGRQPLVPLPRREHGSLFPRGRVKGLWS